ncbi:MAG: hypothetical protein JKY90_05405 [Gammaproteobacteria bacterium]|nr:hypothetical protein [Gammaproteobacteria bacterium]
MTMEIFSLYPRPGQSLFIDLKQKNTEKKASDLFSGGPVEVLFCRASDGKIALSIKVPSELDIFLCDAIEDV